MPYATIDPAHTALVFFDTLNTYYKGPDQNNPRPVPPVVANYVKLYEAAHSLSMPIFYPKADHRPQGDDSARLYSDTSLGNQPWTDPENEQFVAHQALAAGEWKSQVIDEIKPGPNDYLVPKHRWSSFFQTHLELSLRRRGADTLIICGGAIDIGIASTVYAARDLDFHTVIVRDAVTGREAVLEMFLDEVFPKMSRVRTTDQVLDMLHGKPVTIY